MSGDAAAVRPEDFGAAADGRTDDAPAVAKALAVAAAKGRPLAFAAGKTYAVGAPGWAGFCAEGARGLRLLGNGAATVKCLAVPAQYSYGNGQAVFQFKSCTDVRARGLRLDFNGLAADGFALWLCDGVEIRGCDFSNSAALAGGFEHAIHITGSNDVRIDRNTGSKLFYFAFSNTDPGTGATDLRITNNVVRDMTGDPFVGLAQRVLIAGNTFDGFFGLGFANESQAMAAALVPPRPAGTSADIRVLGNRLRNARAGGVSTDVDANMTVDRVTVAGNTIENCRSPAGSAIQAVGARGWTIRDNTILGCVNGITVDRASGVLISGNTIRAGSAAVKARGISITAISGDTVDVRARGNRVEGYADPGERGLGIYVEKNAHGLRGLDVTGNVSRGNRVNLHVGGDVEGAVGDNDLRGSTGTDLKIYYHVTRVRGLSSNRYRTRLEH